MFSANREMLGHPFQVNMSAVHIFHWGGYWTLHIPTEHVVYYLSHIPFDRCKADCFALLAFGILLLNELIDNNNKLFPPYSMFALLLQIEVDT